MLACMHAWRREAWSKRGAGHADSAAIGMTMEQQAAIRIKVLGYVLLNKRVSYWGLNRDWQGPYYGVSWLISINHG
jgi:hypothetical protein